MMDNYQNRNLILKLTCVVSSLLKQWKIVLSIMIVCGMGLDVFKTVTYHPQYSATMQASLTSGETDYAALEGAIAYIKTLDYVFNGQIVNQYIEEQLAVEDLNMTCYITNVDNSNIVNVQVVSNSRSNAFHSLKTIVEWYKDNMSKYNFSYEMNILEDPAINEYTINPNSHKSNFEKGALISGFLVIVLLALQAYFKDTIKTPKDIENRIDCRLFAKIPKENKPRGKKIWIRSKQAILITSLKTSFAYKESIKKLRTRVEQSAKKHGYKSFMITGSLENEGKSSIAANLALSLAQKQYKVLLIDGDLRKPSLHKIFELNTKRCINEYLNGNKAWESQVTYIKKNDLFVMCAKADVDNSEKLINNEKMRTLIKEASKEFDYVIVDSSPACFLNEPLIINEMVDASLLVIKQHLANTRAINETILRLVNAKNNLIGCIYNASVIDLTKEKKVYGYRYGYNRYDRVKRGS